MALIRTHTVNNPTGGTVTVKTNSVLAHTNKVLTLDDVDAASFTAGGCSCVQLAPGMADAPTLAAEIQGFYSGH